MSIDSVPAELRPAMRFAQRYFQSQEREQDEYKNTIASAQKSALETVSVARMMTEPGAEVPMPKSEAETLVTDWNENQTEQKLHTTPTPDPDWVIVSRQTQQPKTWMAAAGKWLGLG